MSEYPDNPNAVVKALRRALFTLFEQHRFDEAADYALSLKEPVIRYSPIESIADRVFKRRAADALELYAVALESARQDASFATSGAEGIARRAEVQRLEKKLAARSKASSSRPTAAKPKPSSKSKAARLTVRPGPAKKKKKSRVPSKPAPRRTRKTTH
jgi:hypothetical protein